MKNLDEKIKQKIIAVISALIPDAKIYLFGSRARGTNAGRADIDIALDAGKPLLQRDVDEVKVCLERVILCIQLMSSIFVKYMV
jgi:predicted nucleotidyltransferase